MQNRTRTDKLRWLFGRRGRSYLHLICRWIPLWLHGLLQILDVLLNRLALVLVLQTKSLVLDYLLLLRHVGLALLGLFLWSHGGRQVELLRVECQPTKYLKAQGVRLCFFLILLNSPIRYVKHSVAVPSLP